MKLIDLYRQIIKCGAQADPRKNKFLIKSYPDSQLLYGAQNTQVRKIMVGIDIEVADLLLADRIRSQEGLDLVLGHHPEGAAYTGLHEVMRLQVDLLAQAGVNRKSAEQLLDKRMQEVERRVLGQNHTRPIDAAKLLKLPYINAHTPADNQVYRFLEKLFLKAKPKKLTDAIDLLMRVPEYKIAAKFNAGPKVILGSLNRPVGKVYFEMTGGTEGPKEVFDKLYKAGVRTLVSMHLSEEHLKKAIEANLNVVIAGHISSDTLGLNLLLDKLEARFKENFQIINCSGFTRIKRK
ncbi:MAG: NGG1p interacting factor NIF3 [Candidatus Omnitrophica bacterium]|jgi:putative NIF3 family GTP cyclohydrolase 1 type 2|nr:NGG1p interacting factor NIF3 [Candidatus Omnitrophota bacterium]